MVYIYEVPTWFFGYDSLIETIFAIVTLLVSMYAFKIHKFTRSDSSFLFGISFLLISISYLILAVYNLLLLYNVNAVLCRLARVTNEALFSSIEMYAHLILYTFGLVTLLYMTLKTSCRRVYSLLAFLTLIALLFSFNTPHGAYIVTSLLVGYIFTYYFFNYVTKPQPSKLLVMLAFGLLLMANLIAIFSFTSGMYYIAAHAITLVAYLLILINVTLMKRK